MRNFLLFLFIIIFFSHCYNNKNKKEEIYDANLNPNPSSYMTYLPFDMQVLKKSLGEDIEIIRFLITNVDSDIDKELVIAYKIKNEEFIKVSIFDVFQTGVMRRLYTYDTLIAKKDDFLLQVYNLFLENDIAVIIEGKAKEDKYILDIIYYEDEKGYYLIGEFKADYSIVLNFKEIETEYGKYQILKDVVTIESTFSYANSKIQQKNIYEWDNDAKMFKIVATDQIVVFNTQLDKLFNSEKDILNYLKGFWYPQEYISLLNDKSKLANFNEEAIQFISFTEKNEVNIKYEDYIAKYNILKSYRFWGQRPGISLNVESILPSTYLRYLKIDVVLLESDKIQVTGPGTFEEGIYVRFPKSFIEIIREEKENKVQKEKEKLKEFLTKGEFINIEDNKKAFSLTFTVNDEYILTKNQVTEKGYFALLKEKDQYILSLITSQNKSILESRYFLINIEASNKDILVLTPLKINYNGFTLENPKKIAFYKGQQDVDKPN